ncbi:hypothetical protein B0H13DRAFT_1910710 [Mycena leptocephala]|nr:hypothetical protein B0H13DRAFT_1910710 [Mycena leptocephala]
MPVTLKLTDYRTTPLVLQPVTSSQIFASPKVGEALKGLRSRFPGPRGLKSRGSLLTPFTDNSARVPKIKSQNSPESGTTALKASNIQTHVVRLSNAEFSRSLKK